MFGNLYCSWQNRERIDICNWESVYANTLKFVSITTNPGEDARGATETLCDEDEDSLAPETKSIASFVG
jgi:hypothetical protein